MLRDVYPPAPLFGLDRARMRRDVNLLLASSGLGHLCSHLLPICMKEKQLLLLLPSGLRMAFGVVRADVLAGFRGPVLSASRRSLLLRHRIALLPVEASSHRNTGLLEAALSSLKPIFIGIMLQIGWMDHRPKEALLPF